MITRRSFLKSVGAILGTSAAINISHASNVKVKRSPLLDSVTDTPAAIKSVPAYSYYNVQDFCTYTSNDGINWKRQSDESLQCS